ncbi:RNAse PH [Keratinibaculum paraultunense]|uniref:Ribonuclease PH n=1 Tax=Keratinibaculum paraultunense TaxID=1278232 RepID=A0A4R3L2G7_9FIRM|nr:ribonuclease PH [Keratinibaculum paraultunense]QQY80204.1 ribonuclease PH [Keratinibaculum paraultunense]TCS90715.1 RNAse PH [Keratinibaculum paraultunense]
MVRIDGRDYDELRDVKIIRNYLKHPQGSVLIEMGNTKVICTAMIDDKVPPFLKGTNTGWITAEYSMIPGSTVHRKFRDSTRGKVEGRSQEIQRLIGRSLRGVIDLNLIGEKTIWIDCDVIQADGGTRTASITGGFVALVDAVNWLYKKGEIKQIPISNFVSAVSVGIVDNSPILDLCFDEDYRASVDMNVVMTDDNQFIEIQGTGEKSTFSKDELYKLLNLAEKGNEKLVSKQKEVLGNISKLIGKDKEGEVHG